MAGIEIYNDTINPFCLTTAREFVYQHRNIFSKRTYRRTLYVGESVIIIKEIDTSPTGEKHVWFWGFGKTHRGIVKDVSDKEAVRMLVNALAE